VTELVNRYLARFRLAQVFEADELAHMLLPQMDVVNSWVVQSPGAPADATIPSDFRTYGFVAQQ